MNDRPASGRRRKKEPREATSRTKMGRSKVRIGDLVHVRDPRDSGQEFTAKVTGGYELGDSWQLRLGPPPSGGPEQRIPRQSTKAGYVRAVYRKDR